MFPAIPEGSSRHVHARPGRRTRYPDLSPAALFGRETDGDEPNTEGPDSWPPWTDAPVEIIDYESFDDSGDLVPKGGR